MIRSSYRLSSGNEYVRLKQEENCITLGIFNMRNIYFKKVRKFIDQVEKRSVSISYHQVAENVGCFITFHPYKVHIRL